MKRAAHDGDGFPAGAGRAPILVDVRYHDAERFGPRAPSAFQLDVQFRRARIDMTLGELRVRGRTVIALHVVLDGKLPIGRDRIEFSMCDLGACPAVHAGRTGQSVCGDAKIERILRKGRKDQAFHDSDRERFQGNVIGPERLRHLAGNQQLAVQIVAPRVIGTGQPRGLGFP